GDLVGLNKQITVLAFQMGDGFTMMLFPTCGYIMAALAMAKISFGKWMKFILPLAAFWMVLAMVTLVVAVAINYGPF
ncbi:MAG: C4-dicarboxylate ABC transporter permease, partial [Clostridiales bacterium]